MEGISDLCYPESFAVLELPPPEKFRGWEYSQENVSKWGKRKHSQLKSKGNPVRLRLKGLAQRFEVHLLGELSSWRGSETTPVSGGALDASMSNEQRARGSDDKWKGDMKRMNSIWMTGGTGEDMLFLYMHTYIYLFCLYKGQEVNRTLQGRWMRETHIPRWMSASRGFSGPARLLTSWTFLKRQCLQTVRWRCLPRKWSIIWGGKWGALPLGWPTILG